MDVHQYFFNGRINIRIYIYMLAPPPQEPTFFVLGTVQSLRRCQRFGMVWNFSGVELNVI